MEKSINSIRFLGLDMVNKANSGHPGIVLGAAPIMYTLFTKHLKITPNSSKWFNRDRFILSAGHGSALLYSTLHLAGYEISMNDLKQFRQLNSNTPGHPEFRHTDGVEATTGPLGQGISNAVGIAIGEKYLRHTLNKKDLNIIDHYTYVLCGDGDLQEGIALESLSLAGHLGLERLIILFDSNDVQLDGPTIDAVSENIKMKMESMNWHYQLVEDANDLEAIDTAILRAKETNQPSFIEVKSIIGYGSSKQGTSATHGAPLGVEETDVMREKFNFTNQPFEIDDDVYQDFFKKVVERGDRAHVEWVEMMDEYREIYPDMFGQLEDIITKELHINIDKVMPFEPIGTKEATRNSIGKILPALSEELIALIGGSADLSGSTKVKGINGNFTKDNPTGRNINYGVREHAMAGITNGLVLHHLKGFSGGFFIFSDYMKPSIRLAALMNIPSIFIFTHDSVAVGEDGPTHEPVEQLSMFRTTPHLVTLRPAHANEVRLAARYAIESKRTPVVIALTRQDTTVLTEVNYKQFKQGAYVARDATDFEGILIATGSELEVALKTQEYLKEEKDINVRVVSMPSMELFKKQPQKIKDSILPPNVKKRLAIEMGAPDLWYQFASHVHGIETFGKSAPGEEVIKDFGFTPENLAKRYLEIE
ncbi:MAG: transketolase [Candidatus Izemoplasmataceae bacterium]